MSKKIQLKPSMSRIRRGSTLLHRHRAGAIFALLFSESGGRREREVESSAVLQCVSVCNVHTPTLPNVCLFNDDPLSLD